MVSVKEKILRMEKLRKQIEKCRRCPLYRTRTHTVPGEGDVDAQIMFIGEAPGANEDKRGKPFVGRAGEILNELLAFVALKREDVFICNILKCRPPGNRDPLENEIKACIGSLDIQLKIIEPKIIATLGRFASQYIFQKFSLGNMSISQAHGRVFDVDTPFGKKKIIPLYHPAVATYNPSKKQDLLKDFAVLKPYITHKRQR